MKKLILAAALCGSIAYAADFPEGSAVSITSPGTYTATSNLSYTSISVGTGGATVFDLSGGYTATLSGTGNDVFALTGDDTDLTVKGGTWSFTGSGPVFNRSSGNRGYRRTFTISDGCSFGSPSLTFYVGFGGGDHDAKCIVTGTGSKLSTKSITLCSASTNAQMLVRDGGSVVCTGAIGFDNSNSWTPLRALMDVRGPTSSVTADSVTVGNGHPANTLVVADGATVTINGTGNTTFAIGAGRQSYANRVVVTNEATLSVNKAVAFGGCVGAVASGTYYPATHHNVLEVLDGSTFQCSTFYAGTQYPNSSLDGSSNNFIRVSDSRFSCAAFTFSGSNCVDNTLHVSGSNSQFSASSGVSLFQKKASRNNVIFDGGATGIVAHTSNNLKLLFGAGTENTLSVSNAVLSCDYVQFSGEGCSNNTLRVCGPNAKLVFTSTGSMTGLYYNHPSSNKVVLEDGALWTIGAGFDCGGSNNCVQLLSGSCLSNASSTCIGVQNKAECDDGGEMFVGAGSLLSANQLRLSSDGARLIVSNGTVRATQTTESNSATDGFQSGYDNTTPSYHGTNCVITLMGETPRIESPSSYMGLKRSTKIHFVIPEAGYANDHIPIFGHNLVTDTSLRCTVDVQAFQSALRGRKTLTLMSTARTASSDSIETSTSRNLSLRIMSFPPGYSRRCASP